jgi:hypothetical protein
MGRSFASSRKDLVSFAARAIIGLRDCQKANFPLSATNETFWKPRPTLTRSATFVQWIDLQFIYVPLGDSRPGTPPFGLVTIGHPRGDLRSGLRLRKDVTRSHSIQMDGDILAHTDATLYAQWRALHICPSLLSS